MTAAFNQNFSISEIHKFHEQHNHIIRKPVNDPVLIHGDFSYGNVLLDDEFGLKAVFDFGNTVFGLKELDFIWLYRPAVPNLIQAVVHEYEKQTGTKIDIQRMVEFIFTTALNTLYRYNNDVLAGKDRSEKILTVIERIKFTQEFLNK
ncbi:MAG: aminoglycoside phosphotransferase family protein [Rickettsiales bacterium]|jgi:aminoglycoside phosphotransferase|nr:aminoglycoside phosphotransferase family protein [Rickettsiales bacterium]